MNSYERLQAMVQGKPVDRPGVSAWKHFHLEDRNVNDLVKRTIGWQESNNGDVIKITSGGIYLQE